MATQDRPRNIWKVAKRMEALIPADQVAFRQDFAHALGRMAYHAPEQAGDDAEMVTQAIVRHLGPYGRDLPDWAGRMLAIWKAEDTEPDDYIHD